MIRLERASFGYREREPVLFEVDLTLGGGLTLLVGPNGCGKSTLLKLAAGVERPDAGRVEVDGHDLWTDEVAARRSLAYVPEQPEMTPYASVAEVLDLVCRVRGEARERGRAALAEVGLETLGSRSVRELSMGQRRLALLAAALVGKPTHVLLDEPLEAMDRAVRDRILGWIAGHARAGATVVVVSHEIEPFAALAVRAVTVRAGMCETRDPLPSQRAERMSALEGLARGVATGICPLEPLG